MRTRQLPLVIELPSASTPRPRRNGQGGVTGKLIGTLSALACFALGILMGFGGMYGLGYLRPTPPEVISPAVATEEAVRFLREAVRKPAFQDVQPKVTRDGGERFQAELASFLAKLTYPLEVESVGLVEEFRRPAAKGWRFSRVRANGTLLDGPLIVEQLPDGLALSAEPWGLKPLATAEYRTVETDLTFGLPPVAPPAASPSLAKTAAPAPEGRTPKGVPRGLKRTGQKREDVRAIYLNPEVVWGLARGSAK